MAAMKSVVQKVLLPGECLRSVFPAFIQQFPPVFDR